MSSFTNYSGLAGSPTSVVRLSNYRQLLTTQRPGFVSSLSATAIFVLGVTVVQNVLKVGMTVAVGGKVVGGVYAATAVGNTA